MASPYVGVLHIYYNVAFVKMLMLMLMLITLNVKNIS